MVDRASARGTRFRFHWHLRSAMCAPLWNKDEVIGIIHVDSRCSPMLHGERPRLLTALANYAAVAVERARSTRRSCGGEEARAARPLSCRPRSRAGSGRSDHGAELGPPEVREVTICRRHQRLHSMSETMSPSAVALTAERLLSRMTDVIFKYEGHARQVHRRRDHGRGIGPRSTCRTTRARDQGRARDAGAARPMVTPTARKARPPGSGSDQLRATPVAGEIGSINKKEYTCSATP
jgi:hypothetical protein